MMVFHSAPQRAPWLYMLRLAQKDLGVGSMSQSWLGHWGHEWLPNWHLACGGSIATWLRGVPQHPGMGWRIHPELGWWVSNHQPSSTIINHPQLCRCLSPTFNSPGLVVGNRGERRHPPEASTMLTSCLGASSRLTPLELDANLQASASWGVRARAAVPPWHWCYWYFLTCWSCRKNGRQMEEDVPAENAGFPMSLHGCFMLFPDVSSRVRLCRKWLIQVEFQPWSSLCAHNRWLTGEISGRQK